MRRQRFRERKKRSSKRASSQEPEVKGEEEKDKPDQNPPWFEKLVSTLAVLSHLVRNEGCGKSVVLEALGTSLTFPSMAWDRVIVVTNIPSIINVDIIVQGLFDLYKFTQSHAPARGNRRQSRNKTAIVNGPIEPREIYKDIIDDISVLQAFCYLSIT